MTVPRVVIQEILDYGGSYPDNVIYPEEGTIKFRAWIESRPEFVLSDESKYGSTGFSENGIFFVQFNLGNFPGLAGSPVDWQPGEVLKIEVLHEPTGRIAETEFTIDEGTSPIFRLREKAIILIDPPIKKDIEDNTIYEK
jgi:hypothetical protein